MNCPVCHLEGITTDTINCPQCGSNLEFLSQIQTLKKRNRWKNTLLVLAALIIVCLTTVWLINLLRHPQPIPEQDAGMNTLMAENKILKDSINQMQEHIFKLESVLMVAATETAIIRHIVKEGENLWMIAEKYLGDGNLYTQIASDNNITNPSVIEKGTTLRIKTKDQ